MSGSWIDSVPLRNIVESDDHRGELQDLLSILGRAGGASNRPSTSRAGGVGATTSGITDTSILNYKASSASVVDTSQHLRRHRIRPHGKSFDCVCVTFVSRRSFDVITLTLLPH